METPNQTQINYSQLKDGAFSNDPHGNLKAIPFEDFKEQDGKVDGAFILHLDTSVEEKDLTPFKEQILNASVIDIETPVFTDGRNFSLAHLLKNQFGFDGELRARGPLYPDQLNYLYEVGFTALLLDEDQIEKHGEDNWLKRDAAVALRYQTNTNSKRKNIWAERHSS